jgi:hypothetical protein
MKLESFENSVHLEMRFLRKAVIGVGAGFIIMFGLVLFMKINFFVQGGEFIKNRALGASVCLDAFMGIVNHKPPTEKIEDEILNSLKKDEFSVVVDEVLAVQMIEENRCRLISQSGQVLRSFLIDLKGSEKNVFYFKLSEINEVEISKDEIEVITKDKK